MLKLLLFVYLWTHRLISCSDSERGWEQVQTSERRGGRHPWAFLNCWELNSVRAEAQMSLCHLVFSPISVRFSTSLISLGSLSNKRNWFKVSCLSSQWLSTINWTKQNKNLTIAVSRRRKASKQCLTSKQRVISQQCVTCKQCVTSKQRVIWQRGSIITESVSCREASHCRHHFPRPSLSPHQLPSSPPPPPLRHAASRWWCWWTRMIRLNEQSWRHHL